MPTTRSKKEEIIKEIAEKAQSAKSVVFVDFKGVNVADMEELRKILRKQNDSFKVAKKTLIKLGLKNAGLNVEDMPELQGEAALAFGSDEISAAKAVSKFSKDKKVLSILGGAMEGKFLSVSEVSALAKLPSKQQLIGQLVGTIAAPLQNFVYALNDVNGRMVRVLNAIAGK